MAAIDVGDADAADAMRCQLTEILRTLSKTEAADRDLLEQTARPDRVLIVQGRGVAVEVPRMSP